MFSRKTFLIAAFAIQIVASGTAIADNCSRETLLADPKYMPASEKVGAKNIGDGNIFADALVDFLKDRARAEMSLWAQDRFGSRICGADSKSRKYFSRTCRTYTDAMASGVTMSLDAAFRRNLRADLRDAPFCYMADRRPNELAALLVTAHLLEPLFKGKPDEAIENLGNLALAREAWKDHPETFDALEKTGAIRVLGYMHDAVKDANRVQAIKDKAKATADSYKDITTKTYPDAESRRKDVERFLANAGELLGMLSTPSGTGSKAESKDEQESRVRLVAAINMLMAMSAGEYQEALSEIWNAGYCEDLGSACAIMAAAATMADAESEDQVRAILETYASPVGSWRIKQAGPDSISSLSARVGVAYSRMAPDLSGDVAAQSRYEPVASVGIDYSIPHCWGRARCGAQLQVLDLGAAFADPEREVPGGSIQKRSSDRLAGFVAPGVALYFGITDSPLIVGVSWGKYDNLYEFDDGTNPASAIDTEVLSLFIAADIMLFPF